MGVPFGVLHGVIHKPREQAQWADEVLIGLILEADNLHNQQVTYWISASIENLEGGV